MTEFGTRIRQAREALRHGDEARAFSLRQVAERVGVTHAYLSQVERGMEPPPAEATIRKLAEELRESADELLLLAGRVPGDVTQLLKARPDMVAAVRSLAEVPQERLAVMVRKVREGEW